MAGLYLLNLSWAVLYKITQQFYGKTKDERRVITNHATANMIKQEAGGGYSKDPVEHAATTF